MNHVTQPPSSADIRIFSLFHSKFCYIKKCGHRLNIHIYFLILLTVFESLKIILMIMVIIWCFDVIIMMSGKMATPGFLKITIF